MKTKTCGECRYYFEQANFCGKNAWECIEEDRECCEDFEPPTNGDVIRQMSNEEYAEEFGAEIVILKDFAGNPFKAYRPLSGELCETRAEAKNKSLAWLNAPAESCVKQKGNDNTQPDLSKTDHTESEVKNEMSKLR